MRRVFTILTAFALLLVSLAVGVFTADLPFWLRAMRLPLAADEVYLPVAGIGEAAVGHQRISGLSRRRPSQDRVVGRKRQLVGGSTSRQRHRPGSS